MAENGKMADWSFELIYHILAENYDYWWYLDISSVEMKNNGKNGLKWHKMAENGKMADWSFELIYHILAENYDYWWYLDISSVEMANNGKNGLKWQ